MSMTLRLDPADTIAISDGRPFNQADSGRAIAASVFPPPPDTVYGAARVAFAHAFGWTGTGNWPAEITDVLGDWKDPGQFSISGPHFRVDGADLLPIPAHVMLRKDQNTTTLIALKPAADPLETDLGPLRLIDRPAYEERVDHEMLAGRWGKADAVLRLLKGKSVAPGDLGGDNGWDIDALAASEPRVGLTRVKETRKAEDGKLYAAVRRVLRPGVEMLVEVEGADWPEGKEIAVPFGGEARFCFAEAADAFTAAPEPSGTGQGTGPYTGPYIVCLVTPAILPPPQPGKPVAGLPGQLVMASITGIASHSGRVGNTKGQGNRPQSTHVLPAGSVLFMDGAGSGTFDKRLGDKTHMGYGKFITGVWP